ncbi:hypothetical protein EMIHUDRAFT_48387, partial [Emiliania huxleyi CCMP1516]|uniref:Glycerol-3-phosphate dehydrogenase NAD-dependent N-terminal domain-containing protein n=2 Tax=Emiliania huxleyi TaxID=2903 RepID=A0A0D3J9E2_EMIH1
VALIGSGNWGSAIATEIGINAKACADFEDEVHMWVFEEYVKEEDGKPLTQVINELNENVIYLPGIKLPKNIIAKPDIKECVMGATMMVFVIPHNFL